MGVWFSLCGGYAVVTCLANVGVFRSDWEACSAEAVRRQAVADVSAAVVAVTADGDVAGGRLAGGQRDGGIAVAVAVDIRIPGAGIDRGALVGLTVAVIVNIVALFGRNGAAGITNISLAFID